MEYLTFSKLLQLPQNLHRYQRVMCGGKDNKKNCLQEYEEEEGQIHL